MPYHISLHRSFDIQLSPVAASIIDWAPTHSGNRVGVNTQSSSSNNNNINNNNINNNRIYREQGDVGNGNWRSNTLGSNEVHKLIENGNKVLSDSSRIDDIRIPNISGANNNNNNNNNNESSKIKSSSSISHFNINQRQLLLNSFAAVPLMTRGTLRLNGGLYTASGVTCDNNNNNNNNNSNSRGFSSLFNRNSFFHTSDILQLEFIWGRMQWATICNILCFSWKTKTLPFFEIIGITPSMDWSLQADKLLFNWSGFWRIYTHGGNNNKNNNNNKGSRQYSLISLQSPAERSSHRIYNNNNYYYYYDNDDEVSNIMINTNHNSNTTSASTSSSFSASPSETKTKTSISGKTSLINAKSIEDGNSETQIQNIWGNGESKTSIKTRNSDNLNQTPVGSVKEEYNSSTNNIIKLHQPSSNNNNNNDNNNISDDTLNNNNNNNINLHIHTTHSPSHTNTISSSSSSSSSQLLLLSNKQKQKQITQYKWWRPRELRCGVGFAVKKDLASGVNIFTGSSIHLGRNLIFATHIDVLRRACVAVSVQTINLDFAARLRLNLITWHRTELDIGVGWRPYCFNPQLCNNNNNISNNNNSGVTCRLAHSMGRTSVGITVENTIQHCRVLLYGRNTEEIKRNNNNNSNNNNNNNRGEENENENEEVIHTTKDRLESQQQEYYDISYLGWITNLGSSLVKSSTSLYSSLLSFSSLSSINTDSSNSNSNYYSKNGLENNARAQLSLKEKLALTFRSFVNNAEEFTRQTKFDLNVGIVLERGQPKTFRPFIVLSAH